MKWLLNRFLVLFVKKPEENNAENQANSTDKEYGKALVRKGFLQQKVFTRNQGKNAGKKGYGELFCHVVAHVKPWALTKS
ncbi:MAG: hypothetical protein JWP88_2370 [Flaviaesturariibacter sp.]|nr:hypothetical protein [Flaviaesturariibacter sp.]